MSKRKKDKLCYFVIDSNDPNDFDGPYTLDEAQEILDDLNHFYIVEDEPEEYELQQWRG